MPNFKALQGGLLVAPIIRYLIFNREPERVMKWVDAICKWPFKRIIPCHLANNIKATPSDFRTAFDFLYEPKSKTNILNIFGKGSSAICPIPLEEDLQVLREASKSLTTGGVLFPEAALLKR